MNYDYKLLWLNNYCHVDLVNNQNESDPNVKLGGNNDQDSECR